MKLSVVIPIFNAGENLKRCLDSLKSQIREDMEVILVNDGSTDKSAYICEQYAKRIKNIKVFHQENGGEGAARNKGIMECQGEWVTFVDADDMVTRDFYSVICGNIESHLDIIFFEYRKCGENQSIPVKREKTVQYFDKRDKDTLIRCNFLDKEIMQGSLFNMRSVWGKVFRTKFLFNNGLLFDVGVRVGVDMIFMLKVYSKLNTAKGISLPVYYYNFENPSSITNQYKPDYQLMIDEFSAAVFPWLNEHPDYIVYYENYRLNDIILYIKYDYFHIKNNSCDIEKKKNLNKLLKKGIYAKYYKNSRKLGLLKEYSWKKRVFFWLAMHNCYYILKVIATIKYK